MHPRNLTNRFLIGRRSSSAVLAAVLLLSVGKNAARADDPQVNDETVRQAISRAVAWLKTKRNGEGNWDRGPGSGDRLWAGDSALAVLALLYAGEDPRQDDMTRSLDWLVGQSLGGTYTYGTRAHALALVPGRKYRKRLAEDMEWITKAINPPGSRFAGGYGYEGARAGGGMGADNSNSQYGVLGAWMGSDAGVRVQDSYWTLVESYWLGAQHADGGWGYQPITQGRSGRSTGSMTAAGLATLFVVLDKVHARDEGAFNGTSSPRCGLYKEATALIEAIENGLEWFGREFTTENPHGDGKWKYYFLYGIERTGRASGKKYFRDRDWFKVGAADLLGSQRSDGSWGNLHDTCFALMFLSHGSAPLLFNKLQHGDDWNNKLRDVAGLNRYAEHKFEKLLNWQIVRLDGPIEDLLEAPVLYMAGHTAWEFDHEQVAKLKAYCERGGMILGVACCSSTEFTRGFKELVKRVYPNRRLAPVTKDHPLINGQVQFTIENPPPLLEIHTGVRTTILLATKDICAPWNQYRERRWENYFLLACNIYLYATDKSSIRSRLQTSEIALKQVNINREVNIARIKYDGNWQIEPYGWTRFAHYMNNETATRLNVTVGVRLDARELRDFKVAHMTGSGAFELSKDEQRGLRRFLTGGGTLLADAAGGSREFLESFEREVSKALSLSERPRYLQKDAILLTGEHIPDATRLDHIGYRRAARAAGRGRRHARIKTFQMGRRFAIIYSPLDLSTGLLGTHVFNCFGYTPETSLRILRNMVLYAQMPSTQKARIGR